MVVVGIILLLLLIIAVSVIRNGHRHREAVAKRAARRKEFQTQQALRAGRIHTVYDRDRVKKLRKEVGWHKAARILHDEYTGTANPPGSEYPGATYPGPAHPDEKGTPE
jgi:hypothetical protein